MKPTPANTASKTLITHVADWLMAQALGESDLEKVVMGCCERLRAAGIPLVRCHFAFTVLHPLHSAIGVTWTRGNGTTVTGYPHLPGGTSEIFKSSPHYYMMEHNLDYLRARICDKTGQYDFPILTDLKKEGVKDYMAFVVGFTHDRRYGMLGSWATNAAGGFSDDTIDALLRIQDRLAVACKMAMKTKLMSNVAFTYLGPDAGSRVLNGQIKRGDGQSIEAAIWYPDLRGSTRMADNLPAQDYIDNLDAYFDVTGGAVREEGGEVLSFIGDGMLAFQKRLMRTVSTMRDGVRSPPHSRRSVAWMKPIRNEKRQTRTRSNSELLFMSERSCTAMWAYRSASLFPSSAPAVNELVRLEKLTKEIREPILVSEQLVGCVGKGCRPLGEHGLRGVGQRMLVHAPERVQASAA